jgi:hypothetical protein
MEFFNLATMAIGHERHAKYEEYQQHRLVDNGNDTYLSGNSYESGKGIFANPNIRPDFIIQYPCKISVCHCPKCLADTLGQFGIDNLVIDSLSGRIFTKKDYSEDAFNWSKAVCNELHWGMSGEVGTCHTCQGTYQPEY